MQIHFGPGRGRLTRRVFACFALVLIAACSRTPAPSETNAGAAALPEADALAPPSFPTKARTAPTFMVSVAHPVAARIGRDVLAKGGSAVDAAVAVQAALTLVEPQSSGIGGGAFMLHYDSDTGRVSAYDGRETAPAAATPRLFLDDAGAPLGFWEAVIGGRAVGVPGTLRLLDLAHNDHGSRDWASLFQPAIETARDGFSVTPRLHKLLAADESLRADPTARAYFYTDAGEARPVGDTLRNPALADTLAAVARDGVSAFYEGPIAAAIVDKVRSHPDNPGKLSEADLAGYAAKRREAVCTPYREHRVCGMPPPTSGGATVAQILGILSNFDMGQYAPLAPEAVHLLAEASRLAFADRNRFLADSDFVDVPLDRLLAPDYLARRAGQIRHDRTLGEATPGLSGDHAAMPDQNGGLSTTHFSIVDAEGNVVSMTSSIEQAFGSHLMVRGFLLNNQLTDFSFRPRVDGRPVANRVEPGKRPRSSMSPSLVLGPGGAPRHAIGSPGGSHIIGFVAQRLVALIDWEMDVQAAINLPNVTNRNGPTRLEQPWRTAFNEDLVATSAEAIVAELKRRGHRIERRAMTSGLHGITLRADGTLAGGADPRREGLVMGR
jgi:gamma-glutamyltranspeptidase/glutathione hydrolase